MSNNGIRAPTADAVAGCSMYSAHVATRSWCDLTWRLIGRIQQFLIPTVSSGQRGIWSISTGIVNMNVHTIIVAVRITPKKNIPRENKKIPLLRDEIAVVNILFGGLGSLECIDGCGSISTSGISTNGCDVDLIPCMSTRIFLLYLGDRRLVKMCESNYVAGYQRSRIGVGLYPYE